MMKPTIGLLVVITTVPAMFMASRSIRRHSQCWFSPRYFFATSSAGMFNHLVDSDIDGDMEELREAITIR